MNIDWGLSIAILAVALTVVSQWRQRRHDRLSLLPALKFEVKYPGINSPGKVELHNHGEGMAVVTRGLIGLDEPSIDMRDGQEVLKQLAEAGYTENLVVGTLSSAEPIRAGGSVTSLIIPPLRPNSGQALLFGRLCARVEYASVYGERFTANWHGIDPLSPDTQALYFSLLVRDEE